MSELSAMPAPVIISASRRTDIPAFHMDSFMEGIRNGYAEYMNPYSGEKCGVSYGKTRFVVFWTKNPKPLLKYVDELEDRGIGFYVQYTLNDYGSIEPNLPTVEERISTFRELSEKAGKERVIWRFDPLILTDEIGVDGLIAKISDIGDSLKGFTERLVFSFVDMYPKVRKHMEANKIPIIEWNDDSMRDFASKLSGVNAGRWGYRLSTCAEKISLSEYGISKNRCIDDGLIARIRHNDEALMKYLGVEVKDAETDLFSGNSEMPSDAIPLGNGRYAVISRHREDKSQRMACGCIASRDIGEYGTCRHGCLYCYAT